MALPRRPAGPSLRDGTVSHLPQVRKIRMNRVAGPNVARASRFMAYESHASHFLRGGPHKIHRFRGVSCNFLHLFLHSIARMAHRPALYLWEAITTSFPSLAWPV